MRLDMSDHATTAPEGVDLAKAYLELTQALRDARAENAKLKTSGQSKLTVKVGEKGGISVYGFGRFPLTLYKSQWIKFWENAETLKAKIEAEYPNASDKA
jgi:hypothetical protein